MLDADDAALLEAAEALPHDAAADPETLDEVRLARQHLARRDVAAGDVLEQLAHGVAVEA